MSRSPVSSTYVSSCSVSSKCVYVCAGSFSCFSFCIKNVSSMSFFYVSLLVTSLRNLWIPVMSFGCVCLCSVLRFFFFDVFLISIVSPQRLCLWVSWALLILPSMPWSVLCSLFQLPVFPCDIELHEPDRRLVPLFSLPWDLSFYFTRLFLPAVSINYYSYIHTIKQEEI